MTDRLPDDLEDRVRGAYQSAAQTVRPQTLRRTSPMLTAVPVPRPLPRSRRMSGFVPLAAAAAVIAAVGVSVTVPRLLTGDASGPPANPAATSIATSGPWHRPPFQIVLTDSSSSKSVLLVESAATGHVVSSVAPPWRDGRWIAIAATGDSTRFVAAAEPESSPYEPTRLYTLTLSARGKVTALIPLAVPTVPGQLTSLAASADSSTVAYTMFEPNGDYAVGVVTGGRTRQWTVPLGPVNGIWEVSVSGNGAMLSFLTTHENTTTAWVLPSGAPAGALTGTARKIFTQTSVGGAGHAGTDLQSALISPGGNEIYLCFVVAGGQPATSVIAYRTADKVSLGTIATWHVGYPGTLTPVAGYPLIWDSGSFGPGGQGDPTAYLLNPAARTKTTVPLHGLPLTDYMAFAW